MKISRGFICIVRFNLLWSLIIVPLFDCVFVSSKYPKTDYTYSHLSRDRVELAPGQVAVPNMSRLSLGLFRKGASVYGGGLDEEESVALQNRTDEMRKRWTSENSSQSYSNSYNRYEVIFIDFSALFIDFKGASVILYGF